MLNLEKVDRKCLSASITFFSLDFTQVNFSDVRYVRNPSEFILEIVIKRKTLMGKCHHTLTLEKHK